MRRGAPPPPPDAVAVQETVKQINTLWLSGRLTRLREFVDDNVVMITPLFAERYNGAQALVDSLQAFVRNAQVQHFADTSHTVDVWGDSAMATFRFDMQYVFDGVAYEDSGHEAWMFARRDGRWRLTWRHQVPLLHRVVGEKKG
jgi:hypothetical protein